MVRNSAYSYIVKNTHDVFAGELFRVSMLQNILRLQRLCWLGALLLGLVLVMNPAQAEDLTSQYNDLKTQMAELNNYERSVSRLRSANGKATVRIGGEINTDYSASWKDNPQNPWTAQAGWQLHNTNLRFTIDLSSNIQARIKLDFSESQYYMQNQILEEALVMWKNICGGPFGVIFGKGEAPYGQDRTLGIIQSYNHTDGSYSPEGQIILNGASFGQRFNAAGSTTPVWHPGEIDRVIMAGVSLDWDDIIKAEFAFFQPWDYEPQAGDSVNGISAIGDSGFESFAGRVWWNTPIEGLVAEVSGVRKHMRRRGSVVGGTEDCYAVSAGFDWILPDMPLEIFAEYQHSWDWNFTEGYDTDTVSVGALYNITDKIRIGAMVEWLNIENNSSTTNYFKTVLHSKYDFKNGIYMMAEYGNEMYNWGSGMTHMVAIRSGVRF